MSDIKLLDSELSGSVDRIRSQIAVVEKDTRYSAEYVEAFKAKRRTDLANTVRLARSQAKAKAEKMRHDSKESFLLASTDLFAVKETALFRDFTAASSTDALVGLAGDPRALSPEQVLILGGELRRRDQNAMADALASARPSSPEPWRESETWQAADLFLADFEACDAAEHYAEQLGTATGPFVMTSDGPQSIDLLL